MISDQSGSWGIGREARALGRQAVLMARGLGRHTEPVMGERAVVFVHGFLAAGPVFDPMRSEVTRRTGLPTLGFTWSPLERFEAIAERLGAFVDAHVEPEATVSVVGHSLGGLLARWWVQELGGAARVDRIVTLATPHAGTRSARFAPGPLAAALRSDGPVVRRLADQAHVLADIPVTVIVAGRDATVSPPSSAAALPGATVEWLDDLGHNESLFDARVHAIVVRALR